MTIPVPSQPSVLSPSLKPWQDPALASDDRVDALMAAMTLEEKAAQLGSHWDRTEDGDVSPDPFNDITSPAVQNSGKPSELTYASASRHGIGHLTRVFGSRPVTPAEGVSAMRQKQVDLVQNTRLGIPALVHEECLTGFTTYGATVYPTPLAWGATFSPQLITRMAHAIGDDLRSVGVHQALAPVLDVARDYRWGRLEETISEDPHLVGTIGTAYVQGLENAGIIATLKHFAGYSASPGGQNHAPVSAGARELHDVFLPPFEMAVRHGQARSVMNAYNDVDGVPCAASEALLTETLRHDWGFTGTVVSDYSAIEFLHFTHHVASDLDGAAALALRAGIDVELPNTVAFVTLADQVRSGRITEETLDRAVRRVLTQKCELGLLDADWDAHATVPTGVDLDSPANRALAREVAEKSVVLLQNRGQTLPLDRTVGSIAVVGPVADDPRTLLGCYSFPNHVLSESTSSDLGITLVTLLDAIRSEYPTSQVTHARGAEIMSDDHSGIAAAVRAASSSDVAIVTVGDRSGLFGRGTSGEGCDRTDLQLPGSQADLVEAVLNTDTPAVIVAISGRPYALGQYADRAAAIIQAFIPGAEGAVAIARVISGALNPSGRLPVGIPRHPSGQPHTYLSPRLGRANPGISEVDPTPAFPFGSGLSYTEFSYEDIRLSPRTIVTTGSTEVSVTVCNTGARPGEEVVQLYLHDVNAQVVRPVQQLIGYARVHLMPGQSRRVAFTVHADRTSFTGVQYRRIVEPGEFTLSVGGSSTTATESASLTIDGNVRYVEGERVMHTPVRFE